MSQKASKQLSLFVNENVSYRVHREMCRIVSNGGPSLTQSLDPFGVQQFCQGTLLLIRISKLLSVRSGVQDVPEKEITHFRVTEG